MTGEPSAQAGKQPGGGDQDGCVCSMTMVTAERSAKKRLTLEPR